MSHETKLASRYSRQSVLDDDFDELAEAVDPRWLQCGDKNLISSVAFVNFIGRIAYNNNNSLDDTVVSSQEASEIFPGLSSSEVLFHFAVSAHSILGKCRDSYQPLLG